ncbi:hypothetical protein RYZ26_00540 [Terasakiella sp. A23]|uniref:hypothetical protein n=1 Tax=Terasakiella sp. FCG-A23 TaxID=3080561 RepID=UPI002952D1A8|nr:hypothetical protein [Terasakiella sp. A23]MDV7338061.1 hypothetical protein [Terasakiella sp. A23]
MQKMMAYPDRVAEKNGDYIEAFSKRLLKALGRKEAEQICRENHWVGVQNYIASSKD